MYTGFLASRLTFTLLGSNKKIGEVLGYPTDPRFLPPTLNFFFQILKLEENISRDFIEMSIRNEKLNFYAFILLYRE